MLKVIIKNMIRKSSKIYCLCKCIKKIKEDESFVSDIVNGNPLLMKCLSYGEENNDKNIYMINAGRVGQGFFAEFRSIINYLMYADRFGFIPVIKLTKDFEYYEENGVNGIRNPYEYYFEQPTRVSVDEVENSFNVFLSNPDHLIYGESYKKNFDGYCLSDAYLKKTGELISKYVKLKPEILEYFHNSICELGFTDYVVGVHVRGSDFKREYKGHPKIISCDRYIEEVRNIISSKAYDKIFLATDDLEAINVFKNEFGSKLIYYNDVQRTSGDVSVIFLANERKLHKYKLGLEVLRDVWTLANCKGLVAGVSQVSICAQMFNVSLNKSYEDKIIIDPGLSDNNKRFKNKE